jgi:hypothetical protein
MSCISVCQLGCYDDYHVDTTTRKVDDVIEYFSTFAKSIIEYCFDMDGIYLKYFHLFMLMCS